MAAREAVAYGGVLSRELLRRLGISRDDVRHEVDAGRWTRLGTRTVYVGHFAVTGRTPEAGPETWPARAWWAVWETANRSVLDGTSALIAAGLTGYREDVVHVSVPGDRAARALPGVRPHYPKTWDVRTGGGLPRTTVEVASVRAAQWARSDRQGALLIAMTVQQRLTSPQRLLARWHDVRRSGRRALLDAVIGDVCDGAHSLGELDVGTACRRRGLPPPTRQVVRAGRGGRVYLDLAWEQLGVCAEVEGAHHAQGLSAVDDALRQNALCLDGTVVLRIPVLGGRLQEDDFMTQLAQILTAAERRRASPWAAQ